MKHSSMRELIRFRHFIMRSIVRELASRFSRSRLGGLWMLFHPLTQAAIYAFVLSSVMAMRLPGIEGRFSYAIYLLAGMLGWSLFAEIVNRCATVFIDHAEIIKKIDFPYLSLPAIAIGVAFSGYVMLLVATLTIYILLGHFTGWVLVWMLPLSILTMLIAGALGFLVGILNVFLRDVGQIVAIFMQLLFWFTPVIYHVDILPLILQDLVIISPVYHVVEMYQSVLVYGKIPSFNSAAYVFCSALFFTGLAAFIYKKAMHDIADVV